jgi:hypothetical protein
LLRENAPLPAGNAYYLISSRHFPQQLAKGSLLTASFINEETNHMNANNLAWLKGTAAFAPGDTMDNAKSKAAEQGYKPCSEGYAAFITAFGREVRNHQVVVSKKAPQAVPAAEENGYRSGGLAAA